MAMIIEQYTQDYFKEKDSIDGLSSVIEIGVQTIPGVKFSLGTDNSNIVTIGSTGIYNLKVNKAVPINTFTLKNKDSFDNFYILVDIIKEEG